MNTETPIFTAARIAACAGKKRQSVQWLLRDTRATGQVSVNGHLVDAWQFSALPAPLQETITHEANRRVIYRDADHFLSALPTPWKPATPLSQIAQHSIDKAGKLKRALQPSLTHRQNDSSLSQGELERLGVEDYKAEFGHSISTRHWRDLFKRTISRDAGAENWARPEIYIENSPALKATFKTSSKAEEEFAELHECQAMFKDPALPSSREQTLYWIRAFEIFTALNKGGKARKKLRRRLLDFLWRHAPWLAKSQNALRTSFDRNFSHWRANDCKIDALIDGREKKKGVPTAKPFNTETVDRLIYHNVVNCGGRVSQGVRELDKSGDLEDDAQLVSLLRKERSNKSAIPHRLRDAVKHEVRNLKPIHQGPRAADKVVPPMDLHYDDLYSLDRMQADDFTWPVMYRVPDRGWWRLTRGQTILVIDVRSTCILSHGSEDRDQPNSLVTRTALTKAFEKWGIPKTLYLERGKVFEHSKLITGGVKAKRLLKSGDALSDAEIELGLRSFGIEIITARRARSKVVERVGGLLQDYMERLPGYCGRNERVDCPEDTRRWATELEKGNEEALEHFFTLDQWVARLWELCEQYNTTSQDGKRLCGLTPLEALEKYQNVDDPPSCFGPECRYLLAHHKIPNLEVKWNGITFHLRGEKFRYVGEETGKRVGQRVDARFNPEIPEFCTFTNRAMKDAFTLSRLPKANAASFDEDTIRAKAQCDAHASVSHRCYRVLKAKFEPILRQNIVRTPATVELGQEIERQQTAIEETRKKQSRIQRRAREFGISSESLSDRPDCEEALREMKEALREMREADATSPSKTYE